MMTSHPFHYERLVAERHAQIQRDMQLSRAQARHTQQPASQPSAATVTHLDDQSRKAGQPKGQALLRAS